MPLERDNDAEGDARVERVLRQLRECRSVVGEMGRPTLATVPRTPKRWPPPDPTATPKPK